MKRIFQIIAIFIAVAALIQTMSFAGDNGEKSGRERSGEPGI